MLLHKGEQGHDVPMRISNIRTNKLSILQHSLEKRCERRARSSYHRESINGETGSSSTLLFSSDTRTMINQECAIPVWGGRDWLINLSPTCRGLLPPSTLNLVLSSLRWDCLGSRKINTRAQAADAGLPFREFGNHECHVWITIVLSNPN